MRRPPHKTVHQPCPFGAFNWAACDEAASHQWGRCKAIVGKTEPESCVRWAASDEGYCGQHYTARVENDKRKARELVSQLQLDERISSYLAWRAEHPSVWDVMGVASSAPPRKGPHRLTEADL